MPAPNDISQLDYLRGSIFYLGNLLSKLAERLKLVTNLLKQIVP